MLDLFGQGTRNCEGMLRRDALRLGSLGALGLTLPGLLRARAARASDSGRESKDVSAILVWLNGGPSHIDSFDPKPDAPAEIRGEFGSIRTREPGVRFTEHLPRLAQRTNLFSLLRAVTSPENGHERATHDLLSGYRFTPAVSYPSYGSVVAREKGARGGDVPGYILLGNFPFGYGGGGYLGAQWNPFQIADDPSRDAFRVRDVTLPSGLSLERLERRESLLAAVDRFERRVDAAQVSTMDAFYEKAYSLIRSPAAKWAFDLSKETARNRERYGKHRFGQSCLLARRLIESGVRFVTIESAGWDTHQSNFDSLKRRLPEVDEGYSALLEDLAERGLLDSTLVILMGEFGRTPKVNPSAGRDHWGRAMSVLLGGGGVRTGLVVGETNDRAEEPTERPVRVNDLAATIYTALGVDLAREFLTPERRPIRVNYEGEPVHEIL